MAEISRFWDGNPGIGDGSVAPYDAGTEFAEVMIGVAGLSSNPQKGGLLSGLSASIPVAGTVRIAPGEGLVYGTWYKSDASIDIVIPTPAAAPRIDYIVLRKDWAAQTVRMAAVTGVEGSGPPVLTQIVGSIWECAVVPLSVASDGTITIVPGNIQAGLWYRTGPSNINTDNYYVGIGDFPITRHNNQRSLQIGNTFGLVYDGGDGSASVQNNTYTAPDGKNYAIVNNGATVQTIVGGTIRWYNAVQPTGGAGGELTFLPRMMLSDQGTFHVSVPDPNHWAAFFTGNATVGQSQGVVIRAGTNTVDSAIIVQSGDTTAPRLGLNGAGALALSPAPGIIGVTVQTGGGQIHMSGGLWGPTNGRLGAGPSMELDAQNGFIAPSTDTTQTLGHPSRRFGTIYLVTAPIIGSSADLKENIAPLDSAACVDAVLNTDWVSFVYPPPPASAYEGFPEPDPIVGPDGPMPAAKTTPEARAAMYSEMVDATAVGRQQKGYVLGSAEYQTADLFGLSDRQSASTHADLAVVACALQQLIKDFNEFRNRPVVGPQNGGRRGAK